MNESHLLGEASGESSQNITTVPGTPPPPPPPPPVIAYPHSQEPCAHYGFIQALCSRPAPSGAVVPERVSNHPNESFTALKPRL